jgi:hypothetical protein
MTGIEKFWSWQISPKSYKFGESHHWLDVLTIYIVGLIQEALSKLVNPPGENFSVSIYPPKIN